MHRSYRRSYLLGLVIALTIFLLITGTVGARWVRMGNFSHTTQINYFCISGFSISVAYAPQPLIEPGLSDLNARIYLITENFGPENGDPPPNEANLPNVIGQWTITLNENQPPITNLPPTPGAGPASSTSYGTAENVWDDPAAIQNAQALYLYLAFYDPQFDDGNSSAYRVNDTPIPLGVCSAGSVSSNSSTARLFDNDNRLNRAQRDLGATAAIFCEDSSVKVYGINAESQGFFAFSVTQDEIDALGQPVTNTLLDSVPSPFGGDIRLYLLTTGELQLNAPGLPPESWKEYVFTWAGCKT